jgi:hypothetical protein
MRLKGDDGYFCEIVALAGETFNLRELDDAELEAWRALAEERATALTSIEAIKRRAFAEGTETLPMQVTGENGEPTIVEVKQQRPYTEDERHELLRLDREERRLLAEATDHAASHGVVGWSLKDSNNVVECSPENVLRLPDWVKARLADRVMAHSALSPGEGDFLSTLPSDSPKGKR